ncbi:MAG TPA: HD domain-containing phosphohydrolase [Bacteriovoracaceae bacterium]|nr:HD domain-containing phosphohydrolase [Bacteriovoracaceae bacterium]
MNNQFIPIRLSTLQPDIPLGFLLLLKVNNQYIKYILPEDPIDKPRYENLRSKKVKKVYIQSKDERLYQRFIDKCLNFDENSDVQEMTRVVAGIAADSIESIYAEPDSMYALAHSEKAANSILNATKLNPEVLKELFNLESEDDISINCAICTCSTAIALARYIKLDEELVKNIATASLLCDISLPRLHANYQTFFTKELSDFTEEELQAYKEHPTRSAEFLQSIPGINSIVLGIIANHEEKISGKGFPRGTKKLTMEEKIVSLSNRYALSIIGHKIPKEQVFKDLFINEIGSYDLELMNILKKLLEA